MPRWVRAFLTIPLLLSAAPATAGDYTVLSADDRSTADRFRVRLQVETSLPVSAEIAESIAKDLVQQRTARRALHVLEVVLHRTGDVHLEAPAAYVVWARNGDPLAPPVGSPGDYQSHRYVVRLGTAAAEALAMRATDLAPPADPAPASAVAPSPSTPLPADTRRSMAVAEATTLLSRWLQAWESKEFDRYAGFYAPSFRSGQMDRTAWLAHKEKVFANAQALSIQASAIDVKSMDDGMRVIVYFMQSYRSDAHEDRGRKTLVLVRVGDDLRIAGEEWVASE